MCRFVSFLLLLTFSFLLGAFAGVHCPVVNHYAGGNGAVECKPPCCKCPCTCGCAEKGFCTCKDCPCDCGCATSKKCDCGSKCKKCK